MRREKERKTNSRGRNVKIPNWCNQLHLCRKNLKDLMTEKFNLLSHISREKMICDVKENMDVVFQVSRTPCVDSKA